MTEFQDSPPQASPERHPSRGTAHHRRLFLGFFLTVLLLSRAAPGWPLSVTTTAISFTGVSLDGTVQAVNGSTSAWQVDADGETGGWNMTVASTDFTNAGSKTIPVANVSVRLTNANIALVSGDANTPTSAQTTFSAMSGTAMKIATAASGEGNGVYDLTPEFQLSVPAESFSGNYSATVTVAVNTGP